MADGGKVIIKIDADTKGFYDKTGKINTFTNTALKGIATGAAAVGSAMVTIGTLAVKSYADYEQLIGGVDTLFKESSKKLQQYASEAYKTAGISANDYMQNVTSFSASLLSSLAGDTEKAADVANMALIDMADNSNKMGTSMEAITTAYQGFAKQQYMLLDNLKLGYGGTKTEMERLLKDAQKITGIKYDINNLADVYNAIHVIQEELGITGTTSKEAATTITGSFNMAKAAWQNLLVGIADPSQDIDVLVDNFVTSVKTVIDNVMPRIKAVASEFVSLFISYLPEGMKVTISAVSAFGAALLMLKLGIVANDLYNVVKRTKEFTTATKLGTAAQKLFNAELALNPYALAATAIVALTAGIITYAATHKSAAKEIRKAYDEEIKAIDDAQKKEMAQAETVEVLTNKLFELESQIKSGGLTDEDAKRKKDEFDGVVTQLNKHIPGLIDNIYDETGAINIQNGKVRELTTSYIALTKAKAMANAYEKKMTATSEAIVDIKEALKPYETGEKNIMQKKSLLGGEYEIESIEYRKLTEDLKKYEEQLSNYAASFDEETKKITDLMGDAGDGGGKGLYNGIKTGLDQTTKKVKDAAEEQAKILKEQQERELKDLKRARDLGEITDEEYYKKLAMHRNKYFEEDSTEWNEHTDEILNYYKDLSDDVVDVYKDQLDSIKREQESMEDKLWDSLSPYKKVTIVGGSESGQDLSYISLNDISKQTDKVKAYGEALEKIKERAGEELPQTLIDKFRELGIDEGLQFAEGLLGVDNSTFKNYISQWKEFGNTVDSVSEALYSDDVLQLKEDVTDAFGQLPQDFFGIGEDSFESFGEGFMQKLSEMMPRLLQSFYSQVSASFPSLAVAGAGGGSTYAPSYYIQSSPGESTQSQLSLIRGAEALAKARGGY